MTNNVVKICRETIIYCKFFHSSIYSVIHFGIIHLSINDIPILYSLIHERSTVIVTASNCQKTVVTDSFLMSLFL